MSEPKDFKRWYERQPNLSQAVSLLIILPDEVRTIIGEATMQLANQEFEESRKSGINRSLGGDKVLGLYKSKNKRREYDQNESLHKAMNYLYILSDENQDFMAIHILKMLNYIQQYFATCREFNENPSLEEVADMTQQYVISGKTAVERFLRNLRDMFRRNIDENKSSTPTRPIMSSTPVIKDDNVTADDNNREMRVKKIDIG
jgi:hypothetical protein